jgi:hypothetical protein
MSVHLGKTTIQNNICCQDTDEKNKIINTQRLIIDGQKLIIEKLEKNLKKQENITDVTNRCNTLLKKEIHLLRSEHTVPTGNLKKPPLFSRAYFESIKSVETKPLICNHSPSTQPPRTAPLFSEAHLGKKREREEDSLETNRNVVPKLKSDGCPAGTQNNKT